MARPGRLTGVVVEKGKAEKSAIQEVQEDYGIPVNSIITMTDLTHLQINFMEKHPDTILLGTAYYEIDKDGKELARNQFPLIDTDLRKILIKLNPFCHASVIMRHSALLKAGLYNEKPVTREQLNWADTIIVMEDRQRSEVGKRFPDMYIKKRIISFDIPDIYN